MCGQPSPIEDNEGKYQAANPTIARRRDELRAGHPFRQRPHLDPRELASISRPTAIHEIGTNALAVSQLQGLPHAHGQAEPLGAPLSISSRFWNSFTRHILRIGRAIRLRQLPGLS